MESYVGKICPYCKTEIKEGEPVKVCPACGIPHHEECWEECGGCTTFGCSEQHYAAQGTNPTDVCANCGAPLGDDQAFCPKCGTPKNGGANTVCTKCGAQLEEGQAFCPRCGQPVGASPDTSANAAILQYNAGIQQKKKKSKKAPVIIALILVVCIAAGAGFVYFFTAQNAAKAKAEYLSDAREFLDLSYTAGVNLEDIADTIQEYWYENIWDDLHGDDIDDAIMYALIAKADEISQAETYDTQLDSLYDDLKSVPKAVSGEDEEELDEICDAVKELYNVYTDFYELATNPSGSYNSYSSDNGDTTDAFLSAYRALDNLVG